MHHEAEIIDSDQAESGATCNVCPGMARAVCTLTLATSYGLRLVNVCDQHDDETASSLVARSSAWDDDQAALETELSALGAEIASEMLALDAGLATMPEGYRGTFDVIERDVRSILFRAVGRFVLVEWGDCDDDEPCLTDQWDMEGRVTTGALMFSVGDFEVTHFVRDGSPLLASAVSGDE